MKLPKKSLAHGTDASHRIEETIKLSESEFRSMEKADGKKVRKIRYYYQYDGHMGELDVFQDDLKGLILADFEFKGTDIKDSHVMPPFCLADVTQSDFTAGGLLAGKSYSDIEEKLKIYGYNKLSFED